VIVEYDFNDGYTGGETNGGTFVLKEGTDCSIDNKLARRGYERLLRKVLTFLPTRPALLGVHIKPPSSGAYWRTAEDENDVVHQYYNVPSVSFRNAYQELLDHRCECFTQDQLTIADGFHLNGLGQSLLSKLVTHYLEQAESAYKGTSTSPYHVPHLPLFSKNQAAHTACLSSDEFKSLVGEAPKGWKWTEAAGKPGFISQQPGSVLIIPFFKAQVPDQELSVGVAYLKSYHDVGVATISCHGACHCTETKLDCFNAEKNSQQYFFFFDVSITDDVEQHHCSIHVAVTQDSSTGGHDVKISGLSWEEGHRGAFSADRETGFWGTVRQREHQ
jgi:hypothetical protein